MAFAGWFVDYGLAFIFGIAFQCFTIAPMRGLGVGEGIKAALKADTLSLRAWQVGMYGWMALAAFAIFGQEIARTNPLFWFMMQIGMAFGFATGFPVNGWLLQRGRKEKMQLDDPRSTRRLAVGVTDVPPHHNEPPDAGAKGQAAQAQQDNTHDVEHPTLPEKLEQCSPCGHQRQACARVGQQRTLIRQGRPVVGQTVPHLPLVLIRRRAVLLFFSGHTAQ